MKSNNKKIFIIYVIVLFIIISIPFIVIWKNNRKDYNANKEEAINFIKENHDKIMEQVNNLLENRQDTCSKWEYFEFCYQKEDTVHIKETEGLSLAKWQLLYSNNKWYFCYKDCDKREVLEDL